MKTKHLIVVALLNILVLASCKKTDPLPTFDDVNTFYANNKTAAIEYIINVDGKADTIHTSNNTEIIFPEGAFNKTGDIVVKVKEISSPGELVLTNNANNIDSTFNNNPTVLEITAEAALLQTDKVYKVSMFNNGYAFDRLSTGNVGTPWSIDKAVNIAAVEPEAGNNTPLGIYNQGSKVVFTYNKLGMIAPSKNPFVSKGKKTKLAIKVYGYTNTNSINTYVISKEFNSVSKARRLTDSEFLSDSVALGTELRFVTICYNQSKKYLGLSNGVADTVGIPISLFEVNSEEEIKTKVNNYLK